MITSIAGKLCSYSPLAILPLTLTLQDHDAHNYGAPGGRNSRVELCIVGCVGLVHAFDTFYVRVGLSVAGTDAMALVFCVRSMIAAFCVLFCMQLILLLPSMVQKLLFFLIYLWFMHHFLGFGFI